MKHWILPANPKTYRHINAFERWGYIDWAQMNNSEVGDIVYIYNVRPSCKIICKTIVEQIGITADDKTIDTEFWTDHDAEKKSLQHGRFCRLKQLCLNPDSALSITFLRELGIRGFQGAQRINVQIASIFNQELKLGNDCVEIDETYPEGAKIQSYVNRFERNPIARQECLKHYKSCKCQICGFDFEKMYGEIGKEFIHIHHIILLYRNELINAFSLYNELSKLPILEKKLVIPKGAIAEFNIPQISYYCRLEFNNDLVVYEGDHLITLMPKCKNIYWQYKSVDYYDFDTNSQNVDHPFQKSNPRLDRFLKGLTQKIPLGITEELFMENCTINGTKLNDYLDGIKISSLILASIKA